MSCKSPVIPQSSSSSPRSRAVARIAASTARQWRRSDSDSTHVVSRDQASSRESVNDMAVRLAQRPIAPPWARPHLEEFVIGRRRLDPHLDAFRAMGGAFEHRRDIVLTAPNGRLRPGTVFMDEPSVMATENVLMAAALTPGQTVIGNAACEPHVQDLARML